VPPTPRLYLVSCAETGLDREGVFQGSAGHQLSRTGIKHAKLLSTHLQNDQIDSFYSSPYEGAFKTASLLAARHRRGVVRLKDLRDMDYGQWTGSTVKVLKESDPELVIAWQFTPHEHCMPGGETLKEVQERIVRTLESTLSVERGDAVCVVTHAIPIKTTLCHFMNEDLSIVWHTPRQHSTALNVIDVEDHEVTVVQLGSLEHLGEEEP
jgi:broad specificity phosphatase PhoE